MHVIFNKEENKNMKKEQFKEWLKVNTTNKDRTISSIISRINRIENAYGDLDTIKKSKFIKILSEFEFSKNEFDAGKMPMHKIVMHGNYYDDTSSLRKDLKLYYDFLFYNNDSYRLFLAHFGIREKEFFDYGLKSLIFVDPNDAYKQMKQLINALLNGGQTLFIRSYGKNGAGDHVFINLYKDLFPKSDIQIDKSNNTRPKQLIQRYKGIRIGTNTVDGDTYNYILSHIFANTKNPLFFEGAFNYCLCPKIYDPFTGKECSLGWNENFSKQLLSKVKKDYQKTIKLIEEFISDNDIINRIDFYCAKNNLSKQEIQDIKKNWSFSA